MLNSKVVEEMRAGAAALAEHNARFRLSPEAFEALTRLHERQQTLNAWERRGWVRVEKQANFNVAANHWERKVLYHAGDQIFLDEDAMLVGASPSELLIAQIALYLAAQGKML